MNRTYERLLATTLVLATYAVSAVAAPVDTPPELIFGVIGREQGDYSPLVSQPAVQAVFKEIAAAPLALQVEAEAFDGAANIDALVEQGLVRRHGRRVHLDFTYFRVEDVVLLETKLSLHAQSLAREILAARNRLDPLLEQLTRPGVSRSVISMVVVACFALDWEGLDLTKELGLRASPGASRTGGTSIPWAFEIAGDELRGLYWGSHNEDFGKNRWTTFGDHYALPRKARPDVMWRASEAYYSDLRAQSLPTNFELVLTSGWDVVSDEMIRGLMEVATISGSMPAYESTVARNAADRILRDLGYIREEEAQTRVAIPLLTGKDSEALGGARTVVREVLRSWLAHNAIATRIDLAQLTPLRHGVPYEIVFNQIWHFLFAYANRELVRTGYVADLYADDWHWCGFVPFVWDTPLAVLPSEP